MNSLLNCGQVQVMQLNFSVPIRIYFHRASFRCKQKTDPIMAAALGQLKQRIDEIENKIREWESKRNVTIVHIADN